MMVDSFAAEAFDAGREDRDQFGHLLQQTVQGIGRMCLPACLDQLEPVLRLLSLLEGPGT